MISKQEIKWILPAIVLFNAIDIFFIIRLGELGGFLSLLFVVPIGVAFGLMAKNDRKKQRIKEWRETHPNAAKDFLPEDLR